MKKDARLPLPILYWRPVPDGGKRMRRAYELILAGRVERKVR